MKKFYLILAILIFLFGCSNEQKEQTQKFPVSKRPDFKEPSDTTGLVLNPEVEKYVKEFDSRYTKTPYYTSLNGRWIFYICNGEWEDPAEGKFHKNVSNMGIMDQERNTLLAMEYDKLYNPDVTASGFIEIERNGKRGLFNYNTGKIFKPEYDVIFPSNKVGIIAFGKRGENYFSIHDSIAEPYTGELPTYSALGEKWNFDIRSKKLNYLRNSYASYMQEGDPIVGDGIVFTPSYLLQLNFLPEIVQDIDIDNKSDFGLTATNGKIEKTISLTEKISILFTSFYEEGIAGREWQINKNNIITVDSKNNVLQSKVFMTAPDVGSTYFCDDKSGFSYMEAEKILEVYEAKHISKEEYSAYDLMTEYDYYQIKENGTIENLESNRVFDFTKYIFINEKHMKGCFYKHMTDLEMEAKSEEGNAWLSNHLSIEDLDLMRNEIFAEYGLKFKTAKWQQYFSKQPWYTPMYDNVDHLLTEIDKKNLEFILSIREKMVGNEVKMTNKRAIMYVAAG